MQEQLFQLSIYVFLYQNLNAIGDKLAVNGIVNLCISILEFKFNKRKNGLRYGSKFMYFYIRI